MKKQFKEKDLVSFGNYLLSEERKHRIFNNYVELVKAGVSDAITPYESIGKVHDADIKNWLFNKETRRLTKKK